MTGVLVHQWQAVAACLVFVCLLWIGRRKGMLVEEGWILMSSGALLVLVGLIVEILSGPPVEGALANDDTLFGESSFVAVTFCLLGLLMFAGGLLWWGRSMIVMRQSYMDLQETHHFLDARIREHTKELRSAQERLVQSAQLASLGQMSAGLTHEINQPLGIIQLNTELTRRMIGDGEIDRGMMSRLQEESQIQCRRITKIIQHLRVFSRNGELTPRDHHDLNDMISESFVLFSEELRIKGIEIKMELAEDLPLPVCNQVQIVQVLTNLISNARDAVEGKDRKRISVRSYQKGVFLCVDVEDNGCGISEEILSKIYDPFFTTKEVGKGSGLGMSISYGIIKEHGGELKVKSKEGIGTSFTVMLPTLQE